MTIPEKLHVLESQSPEKCRPVVIKVGGSLLDLAELPAQLGRLLATVRHHAGRPVLISGGGKIVDEIRRLDSIHSLSSTQSHELAIRAMEVTGFLLNNLVSTENACVVFTLTQIEQALAENRVPIVAPWKILQQDEHSGLENALPHGWETTSDSIAARIATLIHAQELILAKSMGPPESCSLESAAKLGIVDPIMPGILNASLRVGICNLRDNDMHIHWLPQSGQADGSWSKTV